MGNKRKCYPWDVEVTINLVKYVWELELLKMVSLIKFKFLKIPFEQQTHQC